MKRYGTCLQKYLLPPKISPNYSLVHNPRKCDFHLHVPCGTPPPPPSLSIHLFLKGRHTIATPQAELWKASYRVGSADKVECIFKVQPPVTLLNGRQACHITLRLLHNHKADSCLARIHSGPSTEHSFLNHESPSRR